MKRKIELIREIMLKIELCPAGEGWSHDSPIPNADSAEVREHVWLLYEGGLVTGIEISTTASPHFLSNVNLTFEGHDFLDGIRDENIWRKVQNKIG